MLKQRLPSAILLAGIVLLALCLDGSRGLFAFLALGVAIVGLATKEFLDLLAGMGLPVARRLTAGTLMLAMGLQVWLNDRYARQEVVIALACLFLVLSWVAVLGAADRPAALRKLVSGIAAAGLVYFPLACLASIYLELETPSGGRYALMFLVVITKCGDIGGYVVGTLSARLLPGGNHKMTPLLSPKKSWEGAGGGLLLSVAAAWLLRDFMPVAADWRPPAALIAGAVFYVGGLLGDLSVSALKRAAAVKDSGNLIPGMGGVLDVIDSLMLNGPLALLLLQLA